MAEAPQRWILQRNTQNPATALFRENMAGRFKLIKREQKYRLALEIGSPSSGDTAPTEEELAALYTQEKEVFDLVRIAIPLVLSFLTFLPYSVVKLSPWRRLPILH